MAQTKKLSSVFWFLAISSFGACATLAAETDARWIKVAGATLLPMKGLSFYSDESKAMWLSVNARIRGSGRFNAVARDPGDPLQLNPIYDPWDHIHPNDAGNRAMAEAIDLGLFQ